MTPYHDLPEEDFLKMRFHALDAALAADASYWSTEYRKHLRERAVKSLAEAAGAVGYRLVAVEEPVAERVEAVDA